jgi:hypothetical protein
MSTYDWQKSSYSGQAGNCLELRWQKSTHSADAANCLNIAAAPGPTARLHLRESDDPATILTTTPARLAALLSSLKTAAAGQAAGAGAGA